MFDNLLVVKYHLYYISNLKNTYENNLAFLIITVY